MGSMVTIASSSSRVTEVGSSIGAVENHLLNPWNQQMDDEQR
jgi:hypothetical protein